MSIRQQVQEEQSNQLQAFKRLTTTSYSNDAAFRHANNQSSLMSNNEPLPSAGNMDENGVMATLSGYSNTAELTDDAAAAATADEASTAEADRKQSEKYVDSQRQFSLALLNDAIGLGFHTWWILGIALSFCVFTLILAFFAALLDNENLTANVVQIDSLQSITSLVRNLGLDPNDFDNYTKAIRILNDITQLEGARRRLGYPLLWTTKATA